MQIHQKLLKLRQQERQITSQILDVLQIMEDERGYLKLGYSSLFAYLVRGLNYSESTAYQRQSCLRLSQEIPEVKSKINAGELSYSTVAMAFKSIKHKSTSEKRIILKSIENKSSREVKRILAPTAEPIKIKKQVYQDKVHLRLELSHQQHQKLEKLKALKSHGYTMETLLESLIDNELKKYSNTKFKKSASKNKRHIPKLLRNYILEKAQHKCQHLGCQETHYLQIDHIIPVRSGGLPTPENLQVLCASHNRYKN